jgi:hypothetical protein
MKKTKPTYRRRTIALLPDHGQPLAGVRQHVAGPEPPSRNCAGRHSFSGGSEADEIHQQQQHINSPSQISQGMTEIELVDRIKKKDL